MMIRSKEEFDGRRRGLGARGGRGWLMRSIVLVGVVLVAAPASAATFSVTSSTDSADANAGDGVCLAVSGACTLRAAVMEANALAGSDTITLGLDVNLTRGPSIAGTEPTKGDIDITGDVVIEGSGSVVRAVRGQWTGGDADRILEVSGGATVELRNLKLSGGAPAGVATGGGVLVTSGSVLLDRVEVSGNVAGFGGGVACVAGTTDVIDAVIATNAASADGGGLYSQSGCVTTVAASEVSGNTATSSGGGLAGEGSIVTIRNATFFGNRAALGGAVSQRSGGTLRLEHATLTRNGLSADDPGGPGSGGGIFAQNTAAAEIENSILSRNIPNECAGAALTASGINVVFNPEGGAGCVLQGGVLLDDPLLDLEPRTNVYASTTPLPPVMATSGPRSFALLPGSPAIDAVPSASCVAGITEDQRGVARPSPSGGDCDVGSVEIPECGDLVIEAPETCEDPGDPLCDSGTCRLLAPSDQPHDAPASTKTTTGGLVVAYEDCPAGEAIFPSRITQTTGQPTLAGCNPPRPKDPAGATGPDPVCKFQAVSTAKGSYTITKKANGEVTFDAVFVKLATACAGHELRLRVGLNETVEDCQALTGGGEAYPCTLESSALSPMANVLIAPTCIVSGTGACTIDAKLSQSGSLPLMDAGRRTSIEVTSLEVTRIVKDALGNPIGEKTAFVPGVFSDD